MKYLFIIFLFLGCIRKPNIVNQHSIVLGDSNYIIYEPWPIYADSTFEIKCWPDSFVVDTSNVYNTPWIVKIEDDQFGWTTTEGGIYYDSFSLIEYGVVFDNLDSTLKIAPCKEKPKTWQSWESGDVGTGAFWFEYHNPLAYNFIKSSYYSEPLPISTIFKK